MRDTLVRLFETLPALEDYELTPEELVANLMDWIDPDSEPYEDMGAEDEYYQSLPVPYRAKNWYISNLDELQLVKGFTPELIYGTGEFPGLVEFLGVPRGKQRRINANTARPEILDIWVDDLPQGIGDDIVSERLAASFEDRQDLNDRVPTIEGASRFRFSSRIFIIMAEGRYRDSKVTIVTTVVRQIESADSAGEFGEPRPQFGGGTSQLDELSEEIRFRTLCYRMFS